MREGWQVGGVGRRINGGPGRARVGLLLAMGVGAAVGLLAVYFGAKRAAGPVLVCAYGTRFLRFSGAHGFRVEQVAPWDPTWELLAYAARGDKVAYVRWSLGSREVMLSRVAPAAHGGGRCLSRGQGGYVRPFARFTSGGSFLLYEMGDGRPARAVRTSDDREYDMAWLGDVSLRRVVPTGRARVAWTEGGAVAARVTLHLARVADGGREHSTGLPAGRWLLSTWAGAGSRFLRLTEGGRGGGRGLIYRLGERGVPGMPRGVAFRVPWAYVDWWTPVASGAAALWGGTTWVQDRAGLGESTTVVAITPLEAGPGAQNTIGVRCLLAAESASCSPDGRFVASLQRGPDFRSATLCVTDALSGRTRALAAGLPLGAQYMWGSQ